MTHISYQDLVTPEIGISEPKYRSLIPLAFLFIVTAACGELTDYDTQQMRTAMNDSLLTTTESWDVNMTLLEGGHRRIMLEGSYALSLKDPQNETRIQGPVYVQIYDSTGTLESEAWSQHAIYHTDEREFELFDSVRVETVLNRQLYSDYLKWHEGTDNITSDRYVTIITPTDSLYGSGFSGKTDLSDYVFENPRGFILTD